MTLLEYHCDSPPMNIYKLLVGALLTIILIVVVPFLAARFGLLPTLADKAWLILTVTALGLVVKSIIGDVVAGEFLFYKFGYDNCVMTFGAVLTALALQLVSRTDLFAGMSSVVLLRDLPTVSSDPIANRSVQLVIFLLLALTATLVAGAIASAIKKGTAKGPNLLALLNTGLGLLFLGIYVLVLVTKT
jgi:hypothetical protein